MQFNTALCFILLGAGLFFLTTARANLAPWLGGTVAFFALLTSLQDVVGRDFGIDQIFFKPYFEVNRIHVGRMSSLAAACFVFIGIGIILAGVKKSWPYRLAATGLLAGIVAMIAVLVLFGYAFGIAAASGWGAYACMSVNSSLAFLFLSGGLLVWAGRAEPRGNFNFLRWLPVTGSVTLMAMIAFVSAVNLAALKDATFWRKRALQTVFSAHLFEDNLIDLQRGVRGYVTLDDRNALAVYQNSLKLEPLQFNQLVELTRDDSAQQRRLMNLAATMNKIFSLSQRAVALYDQQNFTVEAETDAEIEGQRVFENARDILKDFLQAEQRLLDAREVSEQTDYHNVTHLLVLGSVLAAVLLVFAGYLAAHELRRRRRVELKLRETTALQNAIFSSANYAIISTTMDGLVTTFNATAECYTGYAAHEVIGKKTPSLWHDTAEVAARAEKLSRELGVTIQPGFEVFTAKAARGQLDENEWTFIRKDGTRFSVLLSITALVDQNRKMTGYLGVIADITARKRAEEHLRVSEERFRRAFENAPIGMSLVSPAGRWLKVNCALCEITGYSEAELLATDFQHITHPDDLEKDLEFVRQVLAGTIQSYQMEKRYFHKNGAEVSIMLSVSLVRDQAGEPLYFVSQIENITERKKQESEREKLIAELQAALAEIKTLTGMIPICAWCKSVRSDEGYWQSVEQYVRAHTNATFSHGMCPDCAEKFEAQDDV